MFQNALHNIIIFILFVPLYLTPQSNIQHKTDSLKKRINAENSNQKKIDLLTELTNIYEYESEWVHFDNATEQMLQISRDIQDSSTIAEAYNRLGISCCNKGENKKALKYFRKALNINNLQNDYLSSANSYENIGLVYKDLGDYGNAIAYQIKSLEIRKRYNDQRTFNNYVEIATLHGFIKNPKKQNEYIKLAKNELDKRTNINPSDHAIFYNALAGIYGDKALYDSCIMCYKKVINYSRQVNWKIGIAVGLGNLAEIYYQMGNIDSAIFIHKQSLSLSLEANDCMSISEEYLFLSNLFLEKNQLDSVIIYAENALQRAKDCDLLHEQGQALAFLSDYYKSINDFKQAYIYLELNYNISDSIFSSDVKNNVAELETRYQTKLKEQHIELLTNENQLINQRIAMFIAITITLLLAIAIGILDFIRRKKQNIQREETLKQQLLRSQMNPHFLFNALGSIQNFMYKNEAKKAAGYLNNFASLTRSVLEHSEQELISLSDEIETLRNYLELEKMRANHNFDYTINYSEELDIEFRYIPPMFIQPFVENAIKHGFKKLDYKGVLSINFKEKDKTLSVEIIDNGCGIIHTTKTSKTHRSMSMNIFDERKLLLEKRLKKDIYFVITDRNKSNKNESGTVVTIKLPIGR